MTSRWYFRWGVVLVAALILVVRKTDSFTNPQFWAEDFWPFFVNAESTGASVIFNSYAGYLHLIPRLIAFFATWLDPLYAPTIYVWAAFLFTLAVVAQVLSERVEAPAKVTWALAIVSVPTTVEVLLNPTNVQWVTAFGLLATLLSRDPAKWTDWLADSLRVLCFGLTGPFGVVLAPIALYRAVTRRTRPSLILASLLIAVDLIQFCIWRQTHRGIPPLLSGPWNTGHAFATSARRTFGALFLGPTAAVSAPAGMNLGLALIFAALVAYSLYRRKTHVTITSLVAGTFLVFVTTAVFRARLDLWSPEDMINADRYLYIPKVLVLWLIGIHCFDAGLRDKTRGALAGVGAAAFLLVLIVNVRTWRFDPLPDLHWANYAPEIRRGNAVVVPTNPGWHYTFPGREKH